MKISVYITSYNKGKYLSEAIESILSQTLKPYEIIIIDDASIDDSRSIIDNYYNKYSKLIIPIYNDKNYGISYCRNKALENISGDLVTYLDGDDFFYLNKLEYEANYLNQHKDCQVVFSNFNYLDESGDIIGKFSEDLDKPVEGNIFIDTFVRKYNVSSGKNYIYEMYYKDCAFQAGLYDENIKIWEDWDFRIRMSKLFKYGYCSEVNSIYRKLPNSLHTLNLKIHYIEQVKVYKKNKSLILDLNNEEILHIHDRVFSKIKSLLLNILEKDKNNKKILSLLYYSLHFVLTFKNRKSIFMILKKIFRN